MTGVDRSASASKMCLACNREFQGDFSRCPQDGTALISLKQEDEWIGKVLADRYEVTKLLGKGGMGVVYLARHRMIDRLVAVKMLQAELTQDEMSVKRFQQEAKAASCLSHPHLVTLHDFGITNTGQPFLVMEYLEGRSLLEVLKLNGPLQAQRAVKIFSEVAEGLFHAHNQGILHRDLKPSNILLLNQEGDPDFVKIVDFGLAKLMPWSGKESQHLTKTGEVFGSPIYMSPEQCMGRELRPPSDIYSLGITLFECLTGKPPFRGSNSIQTASKHMSDPPPRFLDVRPDLQLPDSLEKVVMKMLEKEPADRFQTMAEVKDALQGSLHNNGRVDQALVTSSRVAAVDSTNALPSLKQEQDKLRSQAGLRARQSEQRAISPAMIGAAVAGLLVVSGVGFFAVSQFSKPQSEKIAGTLYFADPEGRQAEIMIDKNTITRVGLSDTAAQRLSNFEAKEGELVGYAIEGTEIKPKGADESVLDTVQVKKESADSAGAKSVALVRDFLEKAISESPSSASIYLAKNAQTPRGWQRLFDRRNTLMVSGAFGQGSGFVHHRDIAAIKIKLIGPQKHTVLVDKTKYFSQVPPASRYWWFTVEGGHITGFVDTSAEEWLAP